MWESEAREDRLDIRQSFLHETFFLLCGAEMLGYDYCRCLQRIETGLAYSQVLREGIYARAASSKSNCSATYNRYRRSIIKERTYLQNNRKRLREKSSYLVWWRGSVRENP